MNFNILFIPQYYPGDLADKCAAISRIGLNWAAHNLSMAIKEGFEANGHKAGVINVPSMGSFPPFAKSMFVPGYKDAEVKSIGYCNVTYLKRKTTKWALKKEVNKWCESNEGKKVIFFYSFNYMDIIIDIKEKYDNVKAVLLVTDLPEFATPAKNIFTRINEIISPSTNVKQGRVYDYLDGYVLLAERMKDRLPMNGKPWVLVEGIYNTEVSLSAIPKDPHKVIMYTGNLGERYGIKLLVEAFCAIPDPDYRLWVRGNGELEQYIKAKAEKDNRIVYLDRMNRKELTERQQQATLMVNPVPSSQEFTEYFFPSKTLEYMASGTPTLMADLKCMPEDYHPHLFFFKDETPNGLSMRIQELCNKPAEEMAEFGRKASEFILKNKSPRVQMAKVINFFEQL